MQVDYRIAITIALVGCGGARDARKEPLAVVSTQEPAANPNPTGPSILLGWYCPTGAAGRPSVEPVLARDPSWTVDAQVLARAIGARRVKSLTVMGYAGRRSGSFAVAGAATTGGTSVAVGSFLGSSPCETVDSLGRVTARDERCVQTTRECSLAVGLLEDAGGFEARPYEEDPKLGKTSPGVACEIGNDLVLDVDGDGAPERFDLGGLVSSHVPVELPLVEDGGRVCERSYASMEIAGSALWRAGVIDLDGDGRPEVLYRRGSELFVYGAPNSPGRMELQGRATLTSAPK